MLTLYVLLFSEEVLAFELAGFKGRVGLADSNDARDAVVGSLAVEAFAFGRDNLQLVRGEVGLDPAVEHVVSHTPLVVVACFLESTVLRTLELVTATDDDGLKVLPAALVDGGVALDNCREQTSTADDISSCRIVLVTGRSHVDENILQALELLFRYLSRDAALVDAGRERVDGLTIQHGQTLLAAFTVVADGERVADSDDHDDYDSRNSSQHNHQSSVFVDPLHLGTP